MRNRGVTFHPDPRLLLLLPLLLQLPPCPPGGFSSLSTLGGDAHGRLGELTPSAAAAEAHTVNRDEFVENGLISHLRFVETIEGHRKTQQTRFFFFLVLFNTRVFFLYKWMYVFSTFVATSFSHICGEVSSVFFLFAS